VDGFGQGSELWFVDPQEVGLSGLLETFLAGGHKKTLRPFSFEVQLAQVSVHRTDANRGHRANKGGAPAEKIYLRPSSPSYCWITA
jgi:hypothetical protein